MSEYGNVDTLLSVWENLGLRERQLLLTLAQRIYMGQRQHGLITRNKKHWGVEAIEEALDQSVYACAMLIDFVDDAYDRATSDAEKEAGKDKAFYDKDGHLVSL